MATLTGRDFNIGGKSFSLTPIKSSEAGQDATEYTIKLHTDLDGVFLTRIVSVAGWLMGQDDVWLFARAFTETRALAQTILPVDLWRTGQFRHAYLCVSLDWLEVILFSNEKRQTVRIVLYIQDAHDSDLFRRFFMQASIEEAQRFGIELEREIIEASPEWATENEHRV